MSESVYYVYCIAESTAVAQLPADSLPAAIEEDAQLEDKRFCLEQSSS